MSSCHRTDQQSTLPAWIVAVVGMILGGSSLAYVITHPEPPIVWAAEFVFVCVPAAGVIYGGYWLASRNLPQKFRWGVVKWVLAGSTVAGASTFGYLVGQSFDSIPGAEVGVLALLVALNGAFVSTFTAVSNERRRLPSTGEETGSDSTASSSGARSPSDERGVLLKNRYEWSKTLPTIASINAIAIIENTEIIDLEFSLYDHINPDALNSIVADQARLSLLFPIDDYWIMIAGNELAIGDEPACLGRVQ